MNVKKRYIASIILLACLLAVTAIACYNMQTSGSQATSAIVDIEFDDGLGKGHRTFALVEKSTADQNRYRLMKKIWQRNRPSFVQTRNETKIPKIIHQIWLGPKRPPGFFQKFRESWQKLHPDWEYKLWTDADLAGYNFDLRDLFDESENYGEKSDILRCEILLKYGGVYVDADFECVKPMDELLHKYDFFAGIEPPHEIIESSRVLLVSNALIGAIPNHPILKRHKELIRERWKKAEKECFTNIEKVLVRTFLSFGRAVEERLDSQEQINIVFPSTYFYPIRPMFLRNPPEPPNVFKRLLMAFDIRRERPFSHVVPETMAIHHFASTWQKGTMEVMKEVQKELLRLKAEQRRLAEELQELKNEKQHEQL